jgi:hypothetical protein
MSIESQIVSGLTGFLSLVVSAGFAYLVPRLQKMIDAHVNAKTATVANSVIAGLSSIAQAVVQDFNQKVVADAKAAGAWTPQLAQSVKADAIAAVKSQGAALVALGKSVSVDVEPLIESLIEQAVALHHIDTPKQEQKQGDQQSA